VTRYYDDRKVGETGCLGFRKSTRLGALSDSLEILIREKILVPGQSRFLDMGCADGRVNVFFSYLVKTSVGAEVDDFTLDEYRPLREGLEASLRKQGFPLPPNNLFLLLGDTCDPALHERIRGRTGLSLEDFDLFYTYLTLHDVFARLVAEKAKTGAVFMVYGLDQVLPRYEGLTRLRRLIPRENKLVLYRKEG